MKLLTKQIQAQIPALYVQDGKGDEAIVHVKFFTPWSSWTWYATEATAYMEDGRELPLVEVQEVDSPDVEDVRFFGLVEGLETELGYFSLRELQSVHGPGGLRIERDVHFTSCTLGSLRKAG